MIWRGDLLRALAAAPEESHDAIAESMGFERETPRQPLTKGETMTTTYTAEAARQKKRLARLQHGTMVFWDGQLRPYWVIEWQAENGDGCYWIVDGEGNHATAGEDELSLTPQN